MTDQAEVAQIVWLTLRVTGMATLLGALFGVPLGAWLATRRGVARATLRVLTYTLYGLPPVVAGLLVYLLLSAQGPLGSLQWLFTPTAIVIVETILATPLIAGLTIAALADVPGPVRDAVAASGAPPWRHHWTLLREARLGVVAAIMVGFGRALAEVAAALLVGGNIRHETRTLGTAILQAVDQGDYDFALTLGGILLGLALVTFVALTRLQHAHRRRPA